MIDPRDILGAVYDGKYKGNYPMSETAAAAQLVKQGATPSLVAQIMSGVEADAHWSSIVQSASKLLQHWPALKAKFAPPQQRRNYDPGPAFRLPPRPIDTWEAELTSNCFTSEERRRAAHEMCARWRERIRAAEEMGITGRRLYAQVSGADFDAQIAQARRERDERRYGSPDRFIEPESVGEIVRIEPPDEAERESTEAPPDDELLEELDAVSF